MARPKEFDEAQVLDKAVNLFWCRGYNATSVQDMVEALGINRASLYDTFTDKHTLFIKALQKYRQTQAQALIDAIGQAHSPKELLRQAFAGSIEDMLNDPESKGCFMVNSAVELGIHDAQIARMVEENRCNIENAFATVIAKGQASSEIPTRHDAGALAAFFYNMLNGMRVLAKTNPNRASLEQVAQVALSVLD
jgi:TetR/AcrR family transcriptional regulator, transcriptional repressor for nem operon